MAIGYMIYGLYVGFIWSLYGLYMGFMWLIYVVDICGF